MAATGVAICHQDPGRAAWLFWGGLALTSLGCDFDLENGALGSSNRWVQGPLRLVIIGSYLFGSLAVYGVPMHLS